MCSPGAIGRSLSQAVSGDSCPEGAAGAADLIRLALTSVDCVMQTVTAALLWVGKVRNCSQAGDGAAHF